jgi:hypothetical protein
LTRGAHIRYKEKVPMDKLSPEEISRAVAKIRQRYDEYIYKYFKPKTLKFAFEERYMQALKGRADISNFLLAEISAVEELIGREEAHLEAGIEEGERKESIAERVDRIVEENLQKIRKYPDVAFHPTASEEVRRLLGALKTLVEEHWPRLAVLLRDTSYGRGSMAMVQLESQLRYLGDPGRDGVPSGLSRYFYHLNRFPRDYPAIDREEKEYILESAFFLHDLSEILERVTQNIADLPRPRREGLEAVQAYVLGVIRDFRVKELKRRA